MVLQHSGTEPISSTLPFLGHDGRTLDLPPLTGRPLPPPSHHAPPVGPPGAVYIPEAHMARLPPLQATVPVGFPPMSYVRTNSEASYRSWTGFPPSHRAPLASSVTSAPSSEAVHTPDTSGIGPDVPWSSTRAHSIGSSGRSVSGATGGPKTAYIAPSAQPLRTPVYEALFHPQAPPPASQGPPTTDFHASGISDDNNNDELNLDEEANEGEDEDEYDDADKSGVASKAKGKRSNGLQPGGLPTVSFKESRLPRTTKYKLFEDGEIIDWICSPEAPIDWINEALLPQQPKANPKPVFQLVSRASAILITNY
jgi:hypothetical protein